MRIVFLVDKTAPYFVGGYETRFFELARRLARNHEVSILSGTGPRLDRVAGLTLIRVSPDFGARTRTGSRSLLHSCAFALANVTLPLREINPDVTVVESIPYLHLPILELAPKGVLGSTVLDVVEAWSEHSDSMRFGGQFVTLATRRLLARALPRFDLVVAGSSVTARSLTSHYALDRARVRVIQSGVDIREVTSVRERLSPEAMRNPKYDFITLGRLDQIKRQADFLHALRLLKDRAQWRGRAAVIGDGPLRGELRLLTTKLGIEAQVEFLGFLDSEQKYETLSQARIFVLCSEREGFSIATLEAISCGLPAIVALPETLDVFGVSDVVEDGVNGLYYPVGNVAGLASEMQALLEDPDRYSEMSLAATRHAISFDWDSIGNRFETELVALSAR